MHGTETTLGYDFKFSCVPVHKCLQTKRTMQKWLGTMVVTECVCAGPYGPTGGPVGGQA